MIEIALRPFERSDFARLMDWIQSSEFLVQWAGPTFSYPLDEAQLEKYLQGSEGGQPRRRIFKAIETSTSEVVGHIDLDHIDLQNKSARICRVLVGEHSARGRGIGTQMVSKILEIGFKQLGLHRIELAVFDFNEAAIRCYEKCGFVKEELLRDARRVDNEYWSLYIMGILESGWRMLKSRTSARANK
jgi:RimJ/RimL family protein N-acetyltransferase